MTERYWAVAECMTQQVERAGKEIPGAKVPLFRRVRVRDGKEWDRRAIPRFGQYVFFPIEPTTAREDERRAADTDGVYRILRVSGSDGDPMPGIVTVAEMERIDNAIRSQSWDEIEAPPVEKRTRRRRSRPSKRARAKAMGVAA